MEPEIREAARKQILKKRAFWGLVVTFSVLALLFNVIWFFTGDRDSYWPLWPMIGFAIALLGTGINTFGAGQRPITEEQIDREARRMQGGR